MDSTSFIQLPALNFPEKYQFRLRNEEKKTWIFCPLRKKYLVWTPEEWVRQNVIQFLNLNLNYPLHTMKSEFRMNQNKMMKRADLIIYSKENPFILVECKKPEIQLNQAIFDQTARYNQQISAEHIYLTNGIKHIFAQINNDEKKFDFLEKLPAYSEIT